MAALVPLGRVVATLGALNVFLTPGQDTDELLDRHQSGDWCEVSPEDANQCGPRIPPNRSASSSPTWWACVSQQSAVDNLTKDL
jgi:hypothetical protein